MQSKIRYNEYTSETALHDVANWLNRCGQDDGAENSQTAITSFVVRPNNSDVLDWVRSIDTAASDGCKAAAPPRNLRGWFWRAQM